MTHPIDPSSTVGPARADILDAVHVTHWLLLQLGAADLVQGPGAPPPRGLGAMREALLAALEALWRRYDTAGASRGVG